MCREQLINRMGDIKRGDLISFSHKGKWFIQYVEDVGSSLSRRPALWCIKTGQFPHVFPMDEENVTWIKGIHESILKGVSDASTQL